MAKYTTLTELAEAFKRGELDNGYRVVIDKGGCALSLSQFKDFGYSDGTELDEAAAERENEAHERCQEIFQREYGDPIEELFTLAGIPFEHA